MNKYNFEELQIMLSEVNGYDDSLDYLDYRLNDEDFFRTFFENNLLEIARAISYGEYKYTDDYVTFNRCCNLETISKYKYEEMIEESHDEIVDRYVEMVNNGDIEDYNQYLREME